MIHPYRTFGGDRSSRAGRGKGGGEGGHGVHGHGEEESRSAPAIYKDFENDFGHRRNAGGSVCVDRHQPSERVGPPGD